MASDVPPKFIDPPAWNRPWECFFCGETVRRIEPTPDGWAYHGNEARFGFIEARPDFVARKNEEGSFDNAPRWTCVYHAECMKSHNPPGLSHYGTPENWWLVCRQHGSHF